MGLDTWESRTRDLDEKKKGLLAKERITWTRRFQIEKFWNR
jgi:hypothetical protein